MNNIDRKNVMLSAKRIMAFSPHPDDSELIAGGYLSMLSKKGAHIKLVIITDGSKGTKVLGENVMDIRKKEQIEAAKNLGINDVEFLGIKDLEVPEPKFLMNIILPKIREFSPDVIITVDPFLKYELHPDHINTGFAVMQSVLFYSLPNIASGIPHSNPPAIAVSPSNNPNVILNIDDYIKNKVDSLIAHKSQHLNIDAILEISSFYGKKINCKYGEPFKVLFHDELHVYPFND